MMEIHQPEASQKQYIRLNGREIHIGVCPHCHTQVFADRIIYGCLMELDGVAHVCPPSKRWDV